MENKYKTKQRKLIEEYLIKNEDRFISSEEIYKHMKENSQNVGLTTIYRFLDFLEKNNNVRVDIKNHTKFYQYIKQNCTDHFHLKCKKCGKTIHLECQEFEKVSNHIKEEHKFNLDNNTIIYGTCEECSK